MDPLEIAFSDLIMQLKKKNKQTKKALNLE